MINIKKTLLITLGTLSFMIGFVGIVLPILPTTPFILLSGICYSNSSDKLNSWLCKSKVYVKYVEAYKLKNGMFLKDKLKALFSVTITIVISLYFVRTKALPFYFLITVWIIHFYYLMFKIKLIYNITND